MKFQITISADTIPLALNPAESRFTQNGEEKSYSFQTQENGRRLLRIGTKLYKIDNVEWEQQTLHFTLNGKWCEAQVRDERDILLDEMGFKTAEALNEGKLSAPMPGKILEIMVQEGDKVELGEPVAILEAMKMENELKAPVSGIVGSIGVNEQDSLEKNALILEIEAE
ncbi:MAG TPA: biotin/lipoyl-containing protein [Balneolaceae bacterium]|nr:biotin/lipoyl-containing protein [Balneolaceae bacterium]